MPPLTGPALGGLIILNQVSRLRAEPALLDQAQQLIKRRALLIGWRLANPECLKAKSRCRLLPYRSQNGRQPRQGVRNHVPSRCIPIRAVRQETASASACWPGNVECTHGRAREP